MPSQWLVVTRLRVKLPFSTPRYGDIRFLLWSTVANIMKLNDDTKNIHRARKDTKGKVMLVETARMHTINFHLVYCKKEIEDETPNPTTMQQTISQNPCQYAQIQSNEHFPLTPFLQGASPFVIRST